MTFQFGYGNRAITNKTRGMIESSSRLCESLRTQWLGALHGVTSQPASGRCLVTAAHVCTRPNSRNFFERSQFSILQIYLQEIELIRRRHHGNCSCIVNYEHLKAQGCWTILSNVQILGREKYISPVSTFILATHYSQPWMTIFPTMFSYKPIRE